MKIAELQSRRHEAPEGWSPEVFETVAGALARALVAAVRRERGREAAAEQPAEEEGP